MVHIHNRFCGQSVHNLQILSKDNSLLLIHAFILIVFLLPRSPPPHFVPSSPTDPPQTWVSRRPLASSPPPPSTLSTSWGTSARTSPLKPCKNETQTEEIVFCAENDSSASSRFSSALSPLLSGPSPKQWSIPKSARKSARTRRYRFKLLFHLFDFFIKQLHAHNRMEIECKQWKKISVKEKTCCVSQYFSTSRVALI